jgi:Na+-transporting NADH:ubiquinone oxidoreductase subunit F
MTVEITPRDYSLVGRDAKLAEEIGLANAEWYACPISRTRLKELMQRKDQPAIRDTLVWFGLLIGFGVAGFFTWGTWWAILPFAAYGVLYGSSSDSRWHECGHRTAFRTTWMNDVVYEIASFMIMRESVLWRWSHTRHHTDTIIVGRDPEIAAPRPTNFLNIFLTFFGLLPAPRYFAGIVLHSLGRLRPDEATFVPDLERPKLYRNARIYVAIYLSVIALAIATRSVLPLMYVGLPAVYGSWLMVIYGLTQHAGLAEDVLDHRLNCRTVYMNRVNRFLYWNMNYHVEHHMFPMVPYHALPALHEELKADMPTPYPGLVAAYREIIPALIRQRKDPHYFVKRELPATAQPLPQT